MLTYALSGSLHLYRDHHFGKELAWLKDRFWSAQDPPDLHLVPYNDDHTRTTKTFDVQFNLVDVLELNCITFQSYLTDRWQCLVMPGTDGLDQFLNSVFGNKGNYKHSVHGLLLECVEDKDEIMEDGVENPFIERTKYPLFSPSYILLYVETDNEGNDCICAQLFQSRFNDDATTRILSQLYYHPSHMLTMHENKNDSDDNVHVNYLEALGFFIDETIPSQEIVSTYQWKWDLLGARDQDRMEKERLKQLQRPDFFAKPRPKPVPKKRSHIDLNYLLERQGAVGTSNASHTNRSSTSTTAKTTGSPSTNSKSKRKDMTSSSEQTRKKKTTAAASNDSWETENKETIKKRLWGTMSKHRGHDRRSEKSKLLYQQIYQSCQYVFRHTMKDEQINSQLLDQVIEKHLGFYEDLDLSFSTAL